MKKTIMMPIGRNIRWNSKHVVWNLIMKGIQSLNDGLVKLTFDEKKIILWVILSQRSYTDNIFMVIVPLSTSGTVTAVGDKIQ
jgi:uncharacterized membrane protein